MTQQETYKQHISTQFNTELEGVKNHLLEMGGSVERQLNNAIDSMVVMNIDDAQLVIDRDHFINQMEVSIDEECSHILARRQPAASDLRLVLAVTKITTDLERIGDEAAKIARQAIRLSEVSPSPSNYVEFRHIGSSVLDMLKKVLDAFARLDVELAVEVIKSDRMVDNEFRSAMRSLVTFMMEDPRAIGAVLNEVWALKGLERIGDHTSNIAEHIIYLVRGLDVRHVELEELVSQVKESH